MGRLLRTKNCEIAVMGPCPKALRTVSKASGRSLCSMKSLDALLAGRSRFIADRDTCGNNTRAAASAFKTRRREGVFQVEDIVSACDPFLLASTFRVVCCTCALLQQSPNDDAQRQQNQCSVHDNTLFKGATHHDAQSTPHNGKKHLRHQKTEGDNKQAFRG